MKPYITHRDHVPDEEGAYPAPFHTEKLSIGRDLGGAAGSVRLGVCLDRLPPGRRSSFTHAHSHEEELVYVIRGPVWLRTIAAGGEPEEERLETGAFVSFPAGTQIAHTFWNRGTEDAEIFVVGERRPEDQVYYPEDTGFDAWHAENRPRRHWNPAEGL